MWIAGEGDTESSLRALAADLGMPDRVRLLGYVSDPRPVYEAMDLFALSSLREGLPNVVLEAMAMEVPTEPEVVMLTKKAPISTAGQSR